MFIAPVWIAFLVGVLVGWFWKPRWANLGNNVKFEDSPSDIVSSPREGFDSMQSLNGFKLRTPVFSSPVMDKGLNGERISFSSSTGTANCSSSSRFKTKESVIVTEKDLEHLCRLVERTDDGSPWKYLMDRSTPSMSYQAWHRDPKTGPPQYCCRTVYEDATPEFLRDFFWDDEFRLEWDDMLVHAATIDGCPNTGAMVVHWIRKFPFFCSDREYTIGRRVWESERSYYCITKGVPCPSVPRQNKPRRVDLYYSSWFIQAVDSRKGNGQPSACEVILFHHEDMGIPREIAKFGVRQGMWESVKKIERGFRAYQKARASGRQISRSALMAWISTKISPDYLEYLGNTEDSSENKVLSSTEKSAGASLSKLLLVAGVIVVACTLDRGLLPKTLVSSVARRLANRGRRLQ